VHIIFKKLEAGFLIFFMALVAFRGAVASAVFQAMNNKGFGVKQPHYEAL